MEDSLNKKEDSVYVLYENEGNHQMFYDRDSRKDGYAIPCVYFREAIEKLNYRFKPTFDYEALGSASDAAYIVSFNLLNQRIFNSIKNHKREKCFIFLIEPPIVSEYLYDPILTNYFGKIFIMLDDYVDNKNYFKFFHPMCCEQQTENVPAFSDKKLCVMVQSNHQDGHAKSMYHERRKVVEFFVNNHSEFDLYGNLWNGYPNWRGYLKSPKRELLKNYKFCFCFENMADQYGYMTERLIECFYSGCVPIYLGPKNICDYVPQECFVNRFDFSSYEEIYKFMNAMDEATYKKYISAANDFINSPKAEPFTTRKFSKTILEHIPYRFA